MANTLLSGNVRVLKSEVSKAAYQGVVIAITSIIIATLFVCFYQEGRISLDGIVNAQRSNYALWVLDGIPFVFGFGGNIQALSLPIKPVP